MLKRTLFLLALLAPLGGPALAQSYTCPHEQKTASCADGYTWDKETGSCVEQVVG
ncbi:hypothetical protein [Celeribacter neptunius]|uniref:Chitin binding Peritrophin-A domain-containing protein n=1 Tax=Celeribacter neptunius TaxID=588602 RepID=A0A1I3JVN9_9RHOB|nr:hypothetical protein [Celeribacter neptunius]SFI64140.1 hypothetical protein SAMN04487991_0477 [Celeribacter neptunius]